MGRLSCEGGCHCGAVRIRVRIPQQIEVRSCNCSICDMTGYVHLTVARRDLELLCGEEHLHEYRFNTGAARHLFCNQCGVKSFYVPRSHPHCFSVNLNCLELPEGVEISRGDFDGRNWEENVHQLRHLGD